MALVRGSELVWVLTRIGSPAAREKIRILLDEPPSRHAAILSVALARDSDALPKLVSLLEEGRQLGDYDRRAIAEALGRIGEPSAVPALLAAIDRRDNDPVLEHSLIYALIEINDPASVRLGLAGSNPRTCRAALIALDQMPGGQLQPGELAGFLTAADIDLADTAGWIASRHPDWADALAGFFRDQLEGGGFRGIAFVTLQKQLAALAGARSIQDLLAERLGDLAAETDELRFVLQTMAQCRLKSVPSSWLAPLRRALVSRHDDVMAEAVDTARALPLPADGAAEITAALVKIAQAEERTLDLRLAALAAVPGGLSAIDPTVLKLLRAQLQEDQPAGQRFAAAAILAKAHLSNEQLLELADDLAAAGPLEIEKLLAPFAASQDPRVGEKLIAGLEKAAARSALHVETLRPILKNYGDPLQPAAEKLYAALTADADRQRAGLDEIVAQLAAGDIRRGQAVFNSAKAACASCHAIGYVGGNIGPDLTRVGQIRTERDLVESIVFPSASFVRSYEPVQLQSIDGKVYSGLVRSEAAGSLTLATGAKDLVTIERDQIEQILPGKVSLMPAGLDKQLSSQDLADLVAFLKACR